MALVVVLASSCSAFGGGGGSAAETAASSFLEAWSAGDVDAMAALVADAPDGYAATVGQSRLALQLVTAEATDLEVSTDGDEGTARFRAELGLQGVGRWAYDGAFALVDTDDGWRVRAPDVALHPDVPDDAGLRIVREQGPRAAITADGGQPLAVGGPGEGGRIDELAGSLIGQLRELTAPEAQVAGLEYAAGDLIGADGIEAGFEDQLAGSPTVRVEAVDAAGRPLGVVVHEQAGERPAPLALTLDYATQRAAEQAIADVALPVALVAVDSRTGAVRAVANNPEGFDRALLGEYPPGSTFKIVTASGLLGAGLTPEQILPCPYETRPGDSAPFTNAFGEDYGDLPFIETFAKSCNTTFVEQGFQLGPQGLLEAAETFGFNQPYDLGVPVTLPSFPLPESDTELGAAAIGQGRVTVTPLHMATVAAAAYDGTWRPPHLVGEPPDEGSRPLPEQAMAELPEFLRAAVREGGTGTAVSILGRDTGGKTGTAEFGEEDPPETHAWFAGFIGELGYAVVVEGGGVGGEVAAPIIRRFIELLPPPPVGPGGIEADPSDPEEPGDDGGAAG